MRILGAIQARLGSTRLPGKVLAPLLDHTMLWHLGERVMRAKTLMDVVVLCPMKDFAEISENTPCRTLADDRIDENDLVRRYWYASRAFGAEVVVRICSDNPCIDPVNIDLLVGCYAEHGLLDGHMLSNVGDGEGTRWPQGLGVELYPRELLQSMDELATKEEVDSKYREHPHKMFQDTGRVLEPPCPYEWNPPIRFDVNTQTDLTYIRCIYNEFERNDFTTKELLRWANEQR